MFKNIYTNSLLYISILLFIISCDKGEPVAVNEHEVFTRVVLEVKKTENKAIKNILLRLRAMMTTAMMIMGMMTMVTMITETMTMVTMITETMITEMSTWKSSLIPTQPIM